MACFSLASAKTRSIFSLRFSARPDGATVAILGSLAADTGISIDTQTGGFQICSGGLFRVGCDVTSVPSAAGAQILRNPTCADGMIAKTAETMGGSRRFALDKRKCI